VSKRDRHDSDRRGDRRDSQPEEDQQQRRPGETDLQESDSLTALKAILSKVSAHLHPLKLTQEESIRLVEQLYASVLETDVKLAGEADDTRKSSILAYIQNTSITRDNGRLVVEYQPPKEAPAEAAASERPATTSSEPAAAEARPAVTPATTTPPETTAPPEAPPAAPAEKRAPSSSRPRQSSGTRSGGSKRTSEPKKAEQAAEPVAEPAVADPPPETPASED